MVRPAAPKSAVVALPRGSGRSSIFSGAPLIKRHGLAQQALQIVDPPLIAGMRRHEFGRLPPAVGLRHSLPEFHRFVRIASRNGHQQQADVIGLRFVFAAERQQHAKLAADAHHAENLACLCGSMSETAPAADDSAICTICCWAIRSAP